MVKTYAVIGDPIDHSLSPNIHNAAFRELGLDCTYIAYRIPKGELAEGVESLKKIMISGFNVTIPHKVEMIKFLDVVNDDCSIIGATNTVSNDNGKLIGYNTDMEGFLDPLKRRRVDLKGSKILLIGAGGAARAITTGLAREKAKKITIANRSLENANSLAQFAQKIGIDANALTLNQVGDSASDYDIIVNATSIGLNNEPSPISTKTISEKSVVYDIVYKPINTDLIKQSKKNGATIVYGYEMLLGQAAIAFKIWHGIDAPFDVMKKSILGGF
jgi:shikimate dehydrogenase